MAICIASEDLVTLPQAGRYVPGGPSASTIWRWHLRGIRGHRLEATLIGGRRYTSRQAIERFLRAINGASAAAPSAARLRAISAAEAELDAAGI